MDDKELGDPPVDPPVDSPVDLPVDPLRADEYAKRNDGSLVDTSTGTLVADIT